MGGFIFVVVSLFVIVIIIAWISGNNKQKLYDNLKREIPIFPNEHIGKDFIVLGPVSSSRDNKESAEFDLRLQAKALGANGIICSHFNISSYKTGNVSITKDFAGNNPKLRDTTSIGNTFHFMGTAIKITEAKKEDKMSNLIVELKEAEENTLSEINKQKALLENGLIDKEECENRIADIKNNLENKREQAKDLIQELQEKERIRQIFIEKYEAFIKDKIEEGFEYDEKNKLLKMSSSPIDYKIEQNNDGDCYLVR